MAKLCNSRIIKVRPGGVRHEIPPIRMRKEPFSEVYMVKILLYSKRL